jgi:hypothetical protein
MTARVQKEFVLGRVPALKLLVLKLPIGNEPLDTETVSTKTV